MTPATERHAGLAPVLPNEGIYIGPERPVFLTLPSLNEVAQVRQSYDQAALWDLARSMVRGDLPEGDQTMMWDAGELNERLVLLNPLTVGKFSTLKKAQDYLNDHAAHYRLDIPRAAESLTRANDGSYYLLIAGHRRKRAIRLLQERFGLGDDDLHIAMNVFEDIGFDEAIGLQLRENTYEHPPAHEEARSIERHYRYMQRDGKRVSVRALSNMLGMGESKVSDALAFASLPEEVQDLTPGALSYTIVRQLKPLYDARLALYARRQEEGQVYEEDRETYATQHVLIVADKIKVNMLRGSGEKAAAIIKAQLEMIQQTMSLQDGLFDMPELPVSVARRQSAARVAEIALEILRHQMRTGVLSEEKRHRLAEMAGVTLPSLAPRDAPPSLEIAL